MARIDNLLSHVSSDTLRAQLSDAVAELRRQKKFGLVYEQHIPEMALMPTAGVQVGSQTLLRCDPGDRARYFVESIADGKATLVESLGGTRVEEVSDLLVVKTFAEPVFPGLSFAGAVDQAPGGVTHCVINGENYHVLQLLRYPYRGQVDCIYIDPPYNTGARDWKYNNDYVDAEDEWRHSKWLSFMEKRLRLAGELLHDDGVLIVTIDENEVHHLGALLEELFPLARRQMVSICINPSGASGEGLSRVDEYAFFCFFGQAQPCRTLDDMLSENLADLASVPVGKVEWESLLRRGNTWYRNERRNLCYPVLIDPETGRITGVGEPLAGEDESARLSEIDGAEAAWPVRKDGKLGIWRVDGRRLRALVKQGYAYATGRDTARRTWSLKYLMTGTIKAIDSGAILKVGTGDRGQVLLKANARRGTIAKTIWKRGRHTAGAAGGTQLVAAQLGERNKFSYPKSVYAVQDCLDVAIGDRPGALVLDFFAGSGTTLNAVALMNDRDGGTRRCILTTNNEVDEKTAARLAEASLFVGDSEYEALGVCKAVTIPRVSAVLTGRTPKGDPVTGDYLDDTPCADGFEENATYFDLVYNDPDAVEVGSHFDLVAPLLWLAAGGIGAPPPHEFPGPWYLPEDAPYAVLFDEDHFKEFLMALCGREDMTHVWLVTDSEAAFARMSVRVPGNRQVGMLYRDYLRNFVVGVGVAR